MNPDKDISVYDDEYLPGFYNRIIRYYFYLTNGVSVLNEFRNLFLGIIAVYLALKLDNFIWIAIMFLPALIILTIVGYYSVHRINKVKEFLGTRFSSHYGVRNFDHTKRQTELLEEIKELLSK